MIFMRKYCYGRGDKTLIHLKRSSKTSKYYSKSHYFVTHTGQKSVKRCRNNLFTCYMFKV